jgi:hypothetical protein
MNEEKIWISDSGNYYDGSINYGSISNGTHPLEHRIEELEKKINKIIEFLNKFLDTNIKT